MTRNKVRYMVTVLIIALAAYTFVCMLLFEKTIIFWVELSFSFVAFLLSFLAIRKQRSNEKIFLRLPVYVIALFYLVAQLFTSILFMLVPSIGNPWGYVVAILLLAGFLFVLVLSQMTISHVSSVDMRVSENTSFIGDLILQLNYLKDQVPGNQESIDELLDIARYSNLQSCDKSQEIENTIQVKIKELSTIDKSNSESFSKYCSEIKSLLKYRNQICTRK